MHQNAAECSRMHQNAPKCQKRTKMHQNAPKCTRQNAPKCSRMQQNAPKCTKMSETHQNAAECTTMHQNTQNGAQKGPESRTPPATKEAHPSAVNYPRVNYPPPGGGEQPQEARPGRGVSRHTFACVQSPLGRSVPGCIPSPPAARCAGANYHLENARTPDIS